MSGYLTEDLIAEIFERLPVKSLLKFRSLSKSWYSRISSTDFIRKHTLRFAKANQKVLIQNICRGKCICTLHSEDQLPLCPKTGYQGTMAVEIPDDDTRTVIGFGFDPIINYYKVVVVTCSTVEGAANDVCVYSLGTNSWTVVDTPNTKFCKDASDACFVNGVLNWVVVSKEETVNRPAYRCSIMTFDLSSHVFSTISLPEPYWVTDELTIINGSLAVISSNVDESWFWVRKESNNVSSWSLFYKLKRNNFEFAYVSHPTPSGELFIRCAEGGLNEVYNPKTGVHLTLVKFGKRCLHVVMETIYVESLELLDKEGASAYGEIIRSRETEEIEVQ
ncbi:putative F-box protein At5g15670 [Rutidosis leptorrhynchoides]|uniref:putative F-box protein At5g15670 n=1 Tax=Rutidosis leptorrhynchoides TaxID=125765 RepID=UPI003A99E6D3